jgi:DNA-binding GntR family transcriptional regulator
MFESRVSVSKETSRPSLQFVKARSLPDQIADGIVEGIAAGALAPGQRLIELDLGRL